MASTLSYGFEKPATGDKGSIFWPILEDNIQRTNDHTHNGSNSAKISASASTALVQTVTSAGWSGVGGGLYRQTVTLPAALTSVAGTYDDYGVEIRDSSSGRRLFLQTEKVTSTTFYVYCNDNTVGFKVHYT